MKPNPLLALAAFAAIACALAAATAPAGTRAVQNGPCAFNFSATNALAALVSPYAASGRDTVGNLQRGVRAAAARPDAKPVATVAKPVKVYVHVITATDGTTGAVAQSTIDDQIAVMNLAFAASRTTFTLGAVDTAANDAWYTMGQGSPEELAAKTALRRGGAADLNMYIAGTAGAWGTFPWWYAQNQILDGIVVINRVLPGGPAVQHGEGDVAVHETGHWLGLYHTFQGGCTGSGDYVSDTPPEAVAATLCPTGLDTCSKGGLDPIHNYMDYTEDKCTTEFTAGQNTRMNDMWVSYRQPK
jgi:hypothetical protein